MALAIPLAVSSPYTSSVGVMTTTANMHDRTDQLVKAQVQIGEHGVYCKGTANTPPSNVRDGIALQEREIVPTLLAEARVTYLQRELLQATIVD